MFTTLMYPFCSLFIMYIYVCIILYTLNNISSNLYTCNAVFPQNHKSPSHLLLNIFNVTFTLITKIKFACSARQSVSELLTGIT